MIQNTGPASGDMLFWRTLLEHATCIYVAEDRVPWRAYVKKAMNLLVHEQLEID
jgi:hypothetical protein